MKRGSVSWRARTEQVSSIGAPYCAVKPANISSESGTDAEAAVAQNVCPSTVRRVRRRFAQTGSAEALPRSGGSAPTLNAGDKTALYVHARLFPTATLAERQLYMCGLRGKLAALSTLCVALKKMGFSRKIAQYYSRNRDQLSRARWFSRGPAYAQGRHAYGIFGVPFLPSKFRPRLR